MYVHKHQPGVQCELGPEANIGKVSRVTSRMWKSLPQDRGMVNPNRTHERVLRKIKSHHFLFQIKHTSWPKVAMQRITIHNIMKIYVQKTMIK